MELLFFVVGTNILYLKLYLVLLEDVVLDGINDVKASFALDVSGGSALSEGDAIDYVAGFRIDQFQLDMLLLSSYHLAGAIIINVCGTEYWLLVAGTER